MANQEILARAYTWLDKAIKMEEDGKSESMVNRALQKAVDLENEAFAS